MKCTECDQGIERDWRACPSCGATLTTASICRGCRRELQPEWAACPFCGLAVRVSTASSATIQDSVVKSLEQTQIDASTHARGATLNGGIHVNVGGSYASGSPSEGSAELRYEERVMNILEAGGTTAAARTGLEAFRKRIGLSIRVAREIEQWCADALAPAAVSSTPVAKTTAAKPDDDLGEGYAYDARTLAGFRRLLDGADWSLASPPHNPQGMLEAVHATTGLTFVLIPPGTFWMGSPEAEDGRKDNETRHRVTLTRPYLLSRTACTQAAWDRVGGDDERQWKGERLPIECVSWDAVTAWCRRAGLRLPTEAEWEYACRAGTDTAYSFGDSTGRMGEYRWYRENSGGRTHPVAKKSPNPWGLHDMHGNVREWCENWYGPYPSEAVEDPKGPTSGASDRVHRGGSWGYPAGYARSANRYWSPPGSRYGNLGFRPAQSVATD